MSRKTRLVCLLVVGAMIALAAESWAAPKKKLKAPRRTIKKRASTPTLLPPGTDPAEKTDRKAPWAKLMVARRRNPARFLLLGRNLAPSTSFGLYANGLLIATATSNKKGGVRMWGKIPREHIADVKVELWTVNDLFGDSVKVEVALTTDPTDSGGGDDPDLPPAT
jgi:hypothetical protein